MEFAEKLITIVCVDCWAGSDLAVGQIYYTNLVTLISITVVFLAFEWLSFFLISAQENKCSLRGWASCIWERRRAWEKLWLQCSIWVRPSPPSCQHNVLYCRSVMGFILAFHWGFILCRLWRKLGTVQSG